MVIVSLRLFLRKGVPRLESSSSRSARSQSIRSQPASVAHWVEFLSEARGFLDDSEEDKTPEYLPEDPLESKVCLLVLPPFSPCQVHARCRGLSAPSGIVNFLQPGWLAEGARTQIASDLVPTGFALVGTCDPICGPADTRAGRAARGQQRAVLVL